MIILLLLVLSIPAAGTWTVDDNGPADFDQITDAIASVPAGDVLLVEPGNYAGFNLVKRLTILGRAGGARPHVLGETNLSASLFTLAGFDIDRLIVTGVSGRGRIDDCSVNTVTDFLQQTAVVIDGCAQLVISRTTVQGSKAYSQSGGGEEAGDEGGSAMSIRTSHVTLVDCHLTAAQGFSSDATGSQGGPGGIGLRLTDSSEVVMAGGTITGGKEGFAGCVFCVCHDGAGGPAVKMTSSSLVVRGKAGDAITGGSADSLCPPVIPGKTFDAMNSVIVVSGVSTLVNNSLVNSSLIVPAPPQPFIKIVGTDVPGGVRAVSLHGPAGVTALLAASFAPALLDVGNFEGKLWLNPTALLILNPVPMSGQNTPVMLYLNVPASTAGFEGLCIEFQAFFADTPGALDPTLALAGNVAELIVRF